MHNGQTDESLKEETNKESDCTTQETNVENDETPVKEAEATNFNDSSDERIDGRISKSSGEDNFQDKRNELEEINSDMRRENNSGSSKVLSDTEKDRKGSSQSENYGSKEIDERSSPRNKSNASDNTGDLISTANHETKDKNQTPDSGEVGRTSDLEQRNSTLDSHAHYQTPVTDMHNETPTSNIRNPTPDSEGHLEVSENVKVLEDEEMIPSKPPQLMKTKSLEEPESVSLSALEMVWSYGANPNLRSLNLTCPSRKAVFYASSHTGVIYNYESHSQKLLQGHANEIKGVSMSKDKRWLATGDSGKDSMVIIWDTATGNPVQTIFNPHPNGIITLALTENARYLATISADDVQVLSIWDWTSDGDSPIGSIELSPEFGVQNYVVFNPEDSHQLLSNSDSQVIFYSWEQNGNFIKFSPPLTDTDFHRVVGSFTMSIFQKGSSKALTSTSVGNLVTWDTKAHTSVVPHIMDKSAFKMIKLQQCGITILTSTDQFIVSADMEGRVKFFDGSLKLLHWYQNKELGPFRSLDFDYDPDFNASKLVNSECFDSDATIDAKIFPVRPYIFMTSSTLIARMVSTRSDMQVIGRHQDAGISAIFCHPSLPWFVTGSYSGFLQLWNYEEKKCLASRKFEGAKIYCLSFDPCGNYLAVGTAFGSIYLVDSISLLDETPRPYTHSSVAITKLVFSHNSTFLASVGEDMVVSLYTAGICDPFDYIGRYQAHSRPVCDLSFGISLEDGKPRLFSLGTDRTLVEYDLSSKEELSVLQRDRVEQSAVPQCLSWFPPISKERFILTANDQYKFKLYNATTKMCRFTYLGPTYGSPIRKIAILPTTGSEEKDRLLVYVTDNKIGLQMLPLDGNPFSSMALIGHPDKISDLACSFDGKYVFSSGDNDACVHMWRVNPGALLAQCKLGGEDLIPFYALLDGGREGEFFKEMEDFFYYAQIRNQDVNSMEVRQVSTHVPLIEVPNIMRALGFYPTENEVENMVNEVKYSEYAKTGGYVEEIDIAHFIRLYCNHRPAFGLSSEKMRSAFKILSVDSADSDEPSVDKTELFELLQTKGEHISEYELAECLMTLLGYNVEGGSAEQHEFVPTNTEEILSENLNDSFTATYFTEHVLGFKLASIENPDPVH